MGEAGARVREDFFLRDAGLPSVGPDDNRRIEVMASGLPFAHGVPIAIDTTLVSPIMADGMPRPGAAIRPGIAIQTAIRTKQRTYRELVGSGILRLVVAAIEVGGRMNEEAHLLLKCAADYRARSERAELRGALARAYMGRWVAMLSVATQDTLAATLVDEGVALLTAPSAGPAPLAAHLLLEEW